MSLLLEIKQENRMMTERCSPLRACLRMCILRYPTFHPCCTQQYKSSCRRQLDAIYQCDQERLSKAWKTLWKVKSHTTIWWDFMHKVILRLQVAYLSRIHRGRDASDCPSAIRYEIFSRYLYTQINWIGVNGKMEMRGTLSKRLFLVCFNILSFLIINTLCPPPHHWFFIPSNSRNHTNGN